MLDAWQEMAPMSVCRSELGTLGYMYICVSTCKSFKKEFQKYLNNFRKFTIFPGGLAIIHKSKFL